MTCELVPSVAVDGGGVLPDMPMPGGPLPEGYRFRVAPTDDPRDAVNVYVEGGRVHVVGQYATVHAERIAPNHVALSPVLPGQRSAG